MIAEADMKISLLPIDDIFCDDSFNCRGAIVPRDVIDLAKSIDRIGLQQPITVQPYDRTPGKKFRILSGHRRFQAYRLLDPPRPIIPAIVNATKMTELDARKLNLEENLKRKDLNLLQEALAIRPFAAAGWTMEEIGRELTQSKGWVQTRLALLKLPEEIQQVAAAGMLTQEHIKQLAAMKSVSMQFDAVKRIKEAKLSGEKKKIEVVKKKRDPLARKKREPGEIFSMIETMNGVVGYGLWTRALAWSAGEISDFELLRDLRDFAAERGIVWAIPEEVLREVKI